ncbi:MAG: hypothetical protein HPY52_15110 [Firmicutes bacterium]|nr:hypothetical protein [Bacillota bacterium]
MRYIAALFLIALVVARMVLPDLAFDALSLTLTCIAIGLLILPQIERLLNQIENLEVPGLKLKFSDLAKQTSEAESKSRGKELDRERLILAEERVFRYPDPRGAFVLLASELESLLRERADANGLPEANQLVSVPDLAVLLVDKRLVPVEVLPPIRKFWTIRDNIVHNAHFDIFEGMLYETLDLGVRLLRLALVKMGKADLPASLEVR